jgi:L-type amino acid transporter 6
LESESSEALHAGVATSSAANNHSSSQSMSTRRARLLPTSPDSLQLTLFHSLALVISLQIGSGIFAAPTEVSQNVASPGLGVSVWITSGMLVWTGASCFVELGLIFSQNGGMQEYLRACYGDFMGFLFSWAYVIVIKPCSIAIIATVFAEHLCGAILSASMLSASIVKLFALFGVCFITVLNCSGAKAGPNIASGFLILKIAAVISILFVALYLLAARKAIGVSRSNSGWFGTSHEQQVGNHWRQIAGYVTALFGALYCYGGWEMV